MPFSEAVKLEAKERAHFTCVWCGKYVFPYPRRVPMTAVTSRCLEGFLPTHI